jgi:hypothetical protein
MGAKSGTEQYSVPRSRSMTPTRHGLNDMRGPGLAQPAQELHRPDRDLEQVVCFEWSAQRSTR